MIHEKQKKKQFLEFKSFGLSIPYFNHKWNHVNKFDLFLKVISLLKKSINKPHLKKYDKLYDIAVCRCKSICSCATINQIPECEKLFICNKRGPRFFDLDTRSTIPTMPQNQIDSDREDNKEQINK